MAVGGDGIVPTVERRAAAEALDVAGMALPHRALACLAGVAAALVLGISSDPFQAIRTLGDTDDATRLYQVQQLLNGGAWYDVTLRQIGLPEPLVSHWSRLIDAPLAGLIWLMGLIWPGDHADTPARMLWPLMILFAGLWLAASAVEKLGGRSAAVIAVGLIATSGYATFQFMPGRIDHHNAQIVATAVGALTLMAAMKSGDGAARAGFVMGLGIIVGIEGLPLVAATLALAIVIAAGCPDTRRAVSRACMVFAATLAAGLVINAAPSAWLPAPCDALGLNLVVLAVAGAFVVEVARRLTEHRPVWQHLAVLGVGGLAALAAYLFIEPSCAAGPMAAVPDDIRVIWLSNVREGFSAVRFFDIQPGLVAAFAASMMVAVAIAAFIAWRRPAPHHMLAALILPVFALYGTVFIKFFPYAAWLAMPLTALWIARLGGIGDVPARTVRLAAALGLSHMALIAVATAGVSAAGAETSPMAGDDTTHGQRCAVRSDFEKLNALPTGRVMNFIDLGPHIAALSHHRVLVAPYHRIDRAIVTWHEISTGPVADAEARLRELAIDYVILCGGPTDMADMPAQAREKPTFEEHLLAGRPVPYLAPVTLQGLETPLRIWRLKPEA